jgi:hypothetical protein
MNSTLIALAEPAGLETSSPAANTAAVNLVGIIG